MSQLLHDTDSTVQQSSMNGVFGVVALFHAAVAIEHEPELVLRHVVMLNPKISSKLKTAAWMNVFQVKI